MIGCEDAEVFSATQPPTDREHCKQIKALDGKLYLKWLSGFRDAFAALQKKSEEQKGCCTSARLNYNMYPKCVATVGCNRQCCVSEGGRWTGSLPRAEHGPPVCFSPLAGLVPVDWAWNVGVVTTQRHGKNRVAHLCHSLRFQQGHRGCLQIWHRVSPWTCISTSAGFILTRNKSYTKYTVVYMMWKIFTSAIMFIVSRTCLMEFTAI